MIDYINDAIIDTIKLMPYLIITFIILEYLEHKLNNKTNRMLRENEKYGPIIGSLFGVLPQCGFSAIAANLYSSKIITMGTLIAVFLSTSDEMLPIMIGEKINITLVLKIILTKIIIAIIIGLIIDIIHKKKKTNINNNIKKMCEEEHCSCGKNGIIISSIKHTIKISLFILIANIMINMLIFKLGEDNISNLLTNKNLLTYFLASLIGLIPNCASSVIITKLFISKIITFGTLMSGLLTGSGLGILLLFRTNENIKENIKILSIVYLTGVIVGIIIDFII